MVEHVFLCGLDESQRAEFPTGTTLSLASGTGNLILRLEQMRQRLVGSEPQRLTDFVEIASYVFAADRSIRRGQLTDPGVGAEWRRNFLMVIAVRDLDFWRRPDVSASLSETLEFLSEDTWRFEFVENQHPIQLQEYLEIVQREANDAGGTSIVLFSGGLDSLAGAVHELRHSNRHVVLVSHRNVPLVGTRQVDLAVKLKHDFPLRVTHVSVGNSLTKKLVDREETQRTRSFFFTAIAAVAAHIEKSDRIRFYENGVMSVNLPFSTQVVGARASRSTHPRSLQLIDRTLRLIAEHPIDVDNPFVWMTKGEMISELVATSQAPLITGTISCTRARAANRTYQPHCGTCIQCLQRRLSTLAGGAGELDEADGYDTDFLTGPRNDGPDRIMALGTVNLALDLAMVSDRDFLARFAEPIGLVLQAYPMGERQEIAKKLLNLHQRYGKSVEQLLIAAVKAHVPSVLNRSLAPSSLMAVLLESRLGEYRQERKSLTEPPAEPLIEDMATYAPRNEVIVAVDEQNARILISDRLELDGPANYPLIRFLIKTAKEDQDKGLLHKHHRAHRGKEIADALSIDDVSSVQSTVHRIRRALAEADKALDEREGDPNAIIESTGQGYRLNPKVVIVTPEEFRRL